MGRKVDSELVCEAVKQLYGKYPVSIMADILGVSKTTIYLYARRLGLKTTQYIGTYAKDERIRQLLYAIVEEKIEQIKRSLANRIKNSVSVK